MELCFKFICAAIFLVVVSSHLAFAKNNAEYVKCAEDTQKYSASSKALQDILNADQQDRKSGFLQPGAVLRDQKRRQRVAQIFREGCFKSAKDYANAALVFQHGDKPEDYWQAFLWSKKSVELGDQSQKRMIALSLDRYLISLGHKQLFASQAFKDKSSPCWCLQKVERTFPASIRYQYMKTTLKDQIAWVDSLNAGKKCPSPNDCAIALKPSPLGTIPGFW